MSAVHPVHRPPPSETTKSSGDNSGSKHLLLPILVSGTITTDGTKISDIGTTGLSVALVIAAVTYDCPHDVKAFDRSGIPLGLLSAHSTSPPVAPVSVVTLVVTAFLAHVAIEISCYVSVGAGFPGAGTPASPE